MIVVWNEAGIISMIFRNFLDQKIYNGLKPANESRLILKVCSKDCIEEHLSSTSPTHLLAILNCLDGRDYVKICSGQLRLCEAPIGRARLRRGKEKTLAVQ